MEVGGDYFDVLPLPDGRLALALGDVTGKGTSAVMLMAMIKTALLAQVSADPEPGAVLLALNALALELMQGQLMTFFYAVYDPATRTLTYANAGHLYPYIRRAAGSLESIGTGGLPLGAYGLLGHTPGAVTLAPGDLLVIFSDGIVEATDTDRQLFGFERLEEMLRRLDPRDRAAAARRGRGGPRAHLRGRRAPGRRDPAHRPRRAGPALSLAAPARRAGEFQVWSSASGITLVSPTTGMKLVSPPQRGTTCMCRCPAMPAPAASPRFMPTLKPCGRYSAVSAATMRCKRAIISAHSAGVSRPTSRRWR